MNPILYESNETVFKSNGIGRIHPLSCLVTEERNGQFELEMEVSMEDRHFPDLKEGRLLYALHDETGDKQPFEIYKISRPLNGKVTVYAWHISYRAAKLTVMPFTAESCAGALTGLKANAVGDCPFEFWTDKDTTGSYTVDIPQTLRSRLAGAEGSILDIYGTGEYEWDHFTIKLHLHRGEDTGVVLRYGKNITELKKTTDASDLWYGVCPYWYGQDEAGNESIVTLPEKAVYGNVNLTPFVSVIPLDLSSAWQNPPTVEQLRIKAQAYVASHAVSAVPASIDVSFAALWQTEEFEKMAQLQRLRLCDTLTIIHKNLGVQNKAKIVKTVFNVLLERYDSMTIGEVRSSLSATIQAAADEVRSAVPTTSDMERAIQKATNALTGGLGGHVLINTNASGNPNEILVMDTESISTAQKILRINMNGIGFSSTGYNGRFKSAWTLDGNFVADFITSGTLNTTLLKTGSIAGKNGKVLIDLDNETINLNGQVTANRNVVITTDGKIQAHDGLFSGTISCSAGSIGGFEIDATKLCYGDYINYSNWEDLCAPKGGKGDVYIGRKGISTDSYESGGHVHIVALEDGQIAFRTGAYDCGFIGAYGSTLNVVFKDQEANDVMMLYKNGVSFPGSLVVRGTKSRVVETEFGEKLMYAYEMPSPYFGDIGEGKLDVDGYAYIELDPVFAETVESRTYQVFLQSYSKDGVYVKERHPSYFIVCGSAGAEFAWEVKAKQSGFDQLRLDDRFENTGTGDINYAAEADGLSLSKDYGSQAAEYIEKIEEERIL